MDFLWDFSDKIQPYADHVATFAMVVTTGQLLTPALLVNDIRKAKSSEKFPIAPFIGGFVLSVLFVLFGQIINDMMTIKINLLGIALNVIYLTVFYIYTPTKDKLGVWGKIGLAGAFIAAVVSYTIYEDPAVVPSRFGILLTLILYALVASPLLEIKTVIKNKSTEGWPFPIIFMGFLVGSAWMTHGIVLKSGFMFFQNLIVVLISGFQLSFFLMYPSTPVVETKKKKN
jgi:solute carrier family 50 protein (sugar transporter)